MSAFSKIALQNDADSKFADNTGGDITPQDLRDFVKDVIDSYQDIFLQCDTTTRDGLTPQLGDVIFNTDTNEYNYHNGSEWKVIQAVAPEQVYSAKVNISSAEILNSYTTPVELLPAPGSGKFYHNIYVTIKKIFNTVAYDTNVDAYFQIDDSKSAALDLSFTQTEYKTVVTQFAPTDIDNQPLYFLTDTGDPQNGDGELIIYITYQILDL